MRSGHTRSPRPHLLEDVRLEVLDDLNECDHFAIEDEVRKVDPEQLHTRRWYGRIFRRHCRGDLAPGGAQGACGGVGTDHAIGRCAVPDQLLDQLALATPDVSQAHRRPRRDESGDEIETFAPMGHGTRRTRWLVEEGLNRRLLVR